MRNLIQEVRLGVRMLAKTPVVTAVIVVALALGIGANTVCFTTTYAMLIRPFAFPEIDRLTTVYEGQGQSRQGRSGLSPANLRDWRGQSRSFQSIAAYRGWNVNLTGIAVPERLQAYSVSSSYFPTLGLRPALGRTFSQAEEEPGRNQVVVVSYGFWQTRLASDPNACGRTISLNGQPYTVIGVMPRNFDYPLRAEIWAPLALTAEERAQRSASRLTVRARLKPGVSLAEARAEAATIFGRLEREYPDANRGRTLQVLTLIEDTNSVASRFVLILMATSVFVLLLACANVANLQLARAAGRVRELALRSALGASRWRVVRQFIIESLVVSLLGGAVGLLLAAWGLDLVRAAIPAQVYRWMAGLRDLRLNGAALAFTAGVSILTGVLCALAPALHACSRSALNEALKEGGRGNSSSLDRKPLRKLLVIAEVALALTLLIGAGLMVKTFDGMANRNAGFHPESAMQMSVALDEDAYRSDEQARDYFERTLAGMRRLPQVKAAGAIGWISGAQRLHLQGRPEPVPSDPTVRVRTISAQYTDAMGVPLLKGRTIDERDTADAPRVAVLTESVARRHWNGTDPIGSRFRAGGDTWLTVVGVVGDVRDWFSSEPESTVYVSHLQSSRKSMDFVVRTSVDPAGAIGALCAQSLAINPNQPVYDAKTLEQELAEETSGVRLSANMMAVFAAIALLLAASGVYAVISYHVAQRKHDLGVRVALGATPGDVLRLVVGQALRLAAVGLGIGLPLAFALMRTMSSALYDVVSLDWSTFAGFTLLLALAAFAAGYFPARRAAQVDPIVTLRHE